MSYVFDSFALEFWVKCRRTDFELYYFSLQLETTFHYNWKLLYLHS
jgi:hypothetical protein